MEAVVGPVLDILIRLCDCFGKDFATMWRFQANVKALEVAMDQLRSVYEDVKRRVELEEERHMTRMNQVELWLQNAQELQRKGSDVLEKAHQEGGRRFWRICLENCCSRYKLGKEVKEKLKFVDELKNEGSFDCVSVMLPLGPVDERPLEETVGLIMAYETVRGWIEDKEVKVIGIYGMGGVGKTTLLKMINNVFVKTNYGFDRVVWIVVSKQSTVEKVQDSICEKLKLQESTWRNKSEDEKAVQIFRILQTKKFVLMLDDVWKRVDLVKVGVPPPGVDIMCKVVLTTRYEDVCDQMEADKKVKIECLQREEALSLFKKKVGAATLDAHPVIPKLAEVVAEECRGLPLALITVGRSMAGKTDPHDWDRAITKVRSKPSRIMGMDEDVYHVLRFSYESLCGEAMKSCFMYCCIYPEDYEIMIEDLLELWIGQGLLDEFDDIHSARDKGWEIVGELKAACLLENGKSEEYIKMHDVIRDMALWISNGFNANANRYLVLDHGELLERVSNTSWMNAEMISLWGSTIRNLAESPPCHNVVTLIVRHTAVRMFPSEFLQFMSVIKVLDLSSNYQLAELPSGIDTLVELELLNLSNTRIRELPVQLKNLAKMKYLLLSDTHRLDVIPRQVISSFSLLRVFRISGSSNSESSNTSEDNVLGGGRLHLLEELEFLQHINDISITIFDSHSVQKLESSYKIQNCLRSLCFERCRGLTSLEMSSASMQRMRHLERIDLYYCFLEQFVIQIPNPRALADGCFNSLSKVYVAYCDNLLDLTWLIYAPKLEVLDVAHCLSMVEIVRDLPSHSTRTEENLTIFSRLKKMRLFNLPRVHSIYPEPLPFSSLLEVRVTACRSLRRLPFDSGSASGTLREIRGAMYWWLMLEWVDDSVKKQFRSYYVPEGPIF